MAEATATARSQGEEAAAMAEATATARSQGEEPRARLRRRWLVATADCVRELANGKAEATRAVAAPVIYLRMVCSYWAMWWHTIGQCAGHVQAGDLAEH